jgi:hypothetical protein
MSDIPQFLPASFEALKEPLAEFRQWLTTSGEMVFPPGTEYEVIRFSFRGQHSTIWRKRTGKLTWSPNAAQAYAEWMAANAQAEP